MKHTCHWTGCTKETHPSMWGCIQHWFMLPKPLRDKIYVHYLPGQEITKTPSAGYVKAAKEVQEWIKEHPNG